MDRMQLIDVCRHGHVGCLLCGASRLSRRFLLCRYFNARPVFSVLLCCAASDDRVVCFLFAVAEFLLPFLALFIRFDLMAHAQHHRRNRSKYSQFIRSDSWI